MDIPESEQNLRREAIARRLSGESRKAICEDLHRATSWFDKWWAEYRRHPQTDFADGVRTPHTSPQRTPTTVVQAIVSIRQTLEAAATPETRYGLIGPRAIQGQLEHLGLAVPSAATIQRIMQHAGLTHAIGAGQDTAYYPWPDAWALNAIHATDIITRHVHGGEVIQNFHTIDHYSHAVYLSQHPDKTSQTSGAHLLASWSKLGLPRVQQLDNEGCFAGGTTHPHIVGRVVRLCLFCGVEVWFTPFYEPKRNYQIETFHSIWERAFWSRQAFRDRRHVQQEVPLFEHWYDTAYRPPQLDGRTPAQMREGVQALCLTSRQRELIPLERLPVTAGRIHFMRKVDPTGQIELVNEAWLLGARWIGEYVRATIDTAEQKISFWHQPDATRDWRLLKKQQFRLPEAVQPLKPEFRRKCTRCREYWPS